MRSACHTLVQDFITPLISVNWEENGLKFTGEPLENLPTQVEDFALRDEVNELASILG